MRRLFASLFTLGLLTASPAFAVMEDYPSVKLQGLDKSVGRTVTFEAKVGSTIQYGTLFIKIQSCRKAPPIEKPESAAFLQIWEVPPGEKKSEWSFSGWMFASSPALSAMDHPVYDIWVLDCLGREQPNEEAAAAETDTDADQADLPASDSEQPSEELPTDSEAEPEDTAAPAAQGRDAPSPATDLQEPIPTDSEGEAAPEFDPNQTDPNAPQNLVPDPNAPYSPQAYPSAPQPQAQQPYVRPQDPTGRSGTAYDLMNQGGTNAPPPASAQPYDPDAPFNPNARY